MKNKPRHFLTCCLLAAAVLSMAALLAGCGNKSVSADREYTEEMKNQIADAVGKPDITNFFEYAQLKEIYEMRDDPNLICYWYTRNDMTGKWCYQGKCIGYGLPYGSSITSPDQVVYDAVIGTAVLSMAEPNGLYVNGLSTTATWILSLDGEGEITPVYAETPITVTQYKLDASKCEDWSIPSDY